MNSRENLKTREMIREMKGERIEEEIETATNRGVAISFPATTDNARSAINRQREAKYQYPI